MRRLVGLSLVALWLCPSVAFAVTDEFDTDPTLGGDWEFYDPVGQSIHSTLDGYFRYTFPLGAVMDHWAGVDNAAQLRRSDIPGDDFIVETRVNFIGSGDPELPFWPPAVENYHAGLSVSFGTFDLFYWGFYRGSPLWLERSGTGGLCILDPAIQELSLQIKKVGQTYSFSWRETDDQAWNLVCTRDNVTQTPISVGLVFKTWAGLTSEETFDFDYFKLEEVPDEAPALTFPCPLDAPDQAWLGMPYIREAQLTGYPPPTWTLAQGPSTLIYDPAGLVTGWVPDSPGTVPIQLDLTNDSGSTTAAWDVRVSSASIVRDDDFEVNPKEDPGGWTLYEPQTGIQYSTVDDGGTDWWRMQVPAAGDQGLNWDTWVGVDRAPQLQQPVDPEGDFLIETRVRVAPDAPAPAEGAAFLAGLLVSFDGFTDLIHFNIGGLRTAPNGSLSNVFAERSGMNNLANGYTAGVIAGKPVELRVERRCEVYRFYFRGDGDATWTYVGSYRTATQPQYVGLIMKTWGAVAWTVDFDYFDFVEPGPNASFTLTPAEGPEPLQISVDGSASNSPGGAITAYEWDFGDGGTASGVTAQHTYASRGEYVVKLTVTDASGDKNATAQPVTVVFRSEAVPPWTPADIGAPALAGGERSEGGCLRILAGGSDIGGTSDQFHFLYQSLVGNGSVVARLSAAEWATNNAKVGVMIREDLSVGSRHASVVAAKTLTSKWAFLRRTTTDGATASKTSTDAYALPNVWMKVERAGEELIGSYSSDGVAWTELGRETIALPQTVYAGIALSARDLGQTGIEVLADVCDASVSGGSGKPVFHRGDANNDGGINITDGIFILNFLFLGGDDPTCTEAANPNDDEAVNITDGIFVLNFLFLGGAAPLPPGPIEDPCGPDPDASPTDLGCETYSNC